ncbi:MAG TPA: hypothetical protein PKL36_14110 [Agitococcus sp.]|nr:hypothetical protein [Agitococcus sp.]
MMGYSPKSFEAVRANRQPLLTALAALAITQLVVRYEGGGDSGDVSELEIFPETLAQANIANTLKVEQVTYHCLAGEYQDGEYRYFLQEQQSSIDSALRDFTLTWVDAHHGGWENNDGGSGTMTINVTEGTFRLEHSEYYTECSNYEYDL